MPQTAAVDVVVGPVQGAVGITENVATYSSGYEHPATAVTPPALSCGLNHPLAGAVTELGAAVNDASGGIVIISAVFVYVGISVSGTSADFIEVGGQGNCVEELAGMEDGVPVCHGA